MDAKPRGVLATILQCPTPPAWRKAHENQQGARVLTSEECIQQMVSKEVRKKEVQEEKERRKAVSGRKRQERAIEAAKKAANKEAKSKGTA